MVKNTENSQKALTHDIRSKYSPSESNCFYNVSVIVVSYNVKEFLQKCLSKLFQSCGNINIEVFVVDNCSGDGSTQMVEDKFRNAMLIPLKENTGFSKANNVALSKVRFPFVLFLNPDVEINLDAIERMASFLFRNREYGAVGGSGYLQSGKPLHSSKRSLPTLWNSLAYFLGLDKLFPSIKFFGGYNLRHMHCETSGDVEAISGSFMMVRKDAIDTIGGFDERFFLYGEDLDLCKRLLENSWKIFYLPSAKAKHHHRASTTKEPFSSAFHFYQSMLTYYNKHFTSARYIFLKPLVHLVVYMLLSTSLIRISFTKIVLWLNATFAKNGD